MNVAAIFVEPFQQQITATVSPPTEKRLSFLALHPDSVSKLTVLIDGEVVVEEWDAAPGQSELQEIPGVEGLVGSLIEIDGVVEIGEYVAILEVRPVLM